MYRDETILVIQHSNHIKGYAISDIEAFRFFVTPDYEPMEFWGDRCHLDAILESQ